MSEAWAALVPYCPWAQRVYSAAEVWPQAVAAARSWCAAAGLPAPKRFTTTLPPAYASNRGLYTYGSQQLAVNVARLRPPVHGTPTRRWSWPGYKADVTVAGVTAHELGHHVQEAVLWAGRMGAHELQVRMRQAQRADRKAVSSYEPCWEEAFAEAFRLYILNPDLLGHACPARYALLERLGLPSGHSMGWQQVLAHASERHREAAANWIAA